MRRQGGGHYGGDSGLGGGSGGRSNGGGHHAHNGSSGQMHQQSHNSKSEHYHGRHKEQQMLGEKERGPQHNNQWRWERDGAQDKLPQTAMSPTAPFSVGSEAPRSYYQNQRLNTQMSSERQGGGDLRPQSHEEDMNIVYEDNIVRPTVEGLEPIFLDDFTKLSKEQTDAEDAENVRHRERINAINKQYEEQLSALRAQHVIRQDEFIRRESQARQQQYQQIVIEPYPTDNKIGPSDPRGYTPVAASTGDPHRSYNSELYDSYGERSNARDHGYTSKVPYPKDRAYVSGSRYY